MDWSFILFYIFPAILLLALHCFDEIDCYNKLRLRAVILGLIIAVIPVINVVLLFSLVVHLINKHPVVLYRRKYK